AAPGWHRVVEVVWEQNLSQPGTERAVRLAGRGQRLRPLVGARRAPHRSPCSVARPRPRRPRPAPPPLPRRPPPHRPGAPRNAPLIDLALEEPPVPLTRELVYCRFPLLDGAGNSPWLLRAALDTTAALLASRVPTLVFCGAGMSRSPAVAAAALAIVEGHSAE